MGGADGLCAPGISTREQLAAVVKAAAQDGERARLRRRPSMPV
jgi:hypothetical protein